MPRRWLLHPMALSLVLVCVACARAGAEVQLSGTQDNVVLRANNATMAEILSGLSSTFKLRIEFTGSSARQFSGAYSGSLRRVLSRLLVGEDYVIRSAGDGINIVLLGPKGAGPTLRLAAGDPEPVNPVQGWSPAANTALKLTPAVAPIEPAPRADGGQVARLAAADGDASNPIQGWTGSSDLFAKPLSPAEPAAAAQANAADAAKRQTADAQDGDPRVQGWVPTAVQDPWKDLGAKAAPVVDKAAAPSVTDKDEGNPNFQGYMPGWTPPEPGKSVLDSLPMLPGAPLGMHRQ
jgi:hypothetical protein